MVVVVGGVVVVVVVVVVKVRFAFARVAVFIGTVVTIGTNVVTPPFCTTGI
jgi:hypothetical protein